MVYQLSKAVTPTRLVGESGRHGSVTQHKHGAWRAENGSGIMKASASA